MEEHINIVINGEKVVINCKPMHSLFYNIHKLLF